VILTPTPTDPWWHQEPNCTNQREYDLHTEFEFGPTDS